jgi:hypothetical protein
MPTWQAAAAQVCVLLALLLLLLAWAPILLLFVLAAKIVLRWTLCFPAARDMHLSCSSILHTLDPLSWHMLLLLCWQLLGCNRPAFKRTIYLRTKA